jgi:hypothetical protein
MRRTTHVGWAPPTISFASRRSCSRWAMPTLRLSWAAPTLRLLLVCGLLSAVAAAQDFKPVPDVQVLPLPRDEASFQYQGRELTRYYFGPEHIRPFWYPITGPEGRSLTRMGHPHDPNSHRHHYSVWIAHADVAGESFWDDRGVNRIIHERVDLYDDSNTAAVMATTNAWKSTDKNRVLLRDRRRAEVQPLGNNQWRMIVDVELEAPADQPVALGDSGFGIFSVRMAKTIGVNDGNGRLLNSESQLGEKDMFRKPARWVDYSGAVTNTARGGITLLDHPGNVSHPTPFHVRGDGWMGASLTFGRPLTIEPGKPLRLRYALWVHDGVPDHAAIDHQWTTFAELPLADLRPEKKK